MTLHPYPTPTLSSPLPPPVRVTTAHGAAIVHAHRERLPGSGIGVRWIVAWHSGGRSSGLTLSVETAHAALDDVLTSGRGAP